jgi:maltooligosyltrehalose trehalohydrolase
VLLFVPETILLFQGQEYAATAPFQFFTDHPPELGRLVTEGRRREFSGFAAFADPERQARIPDPQDVQTHQRSMPDHAERDENADVYALYRDLLAMRRDDPVLKRQDRLAMRARALSQHVLAIRRSHDGQERLLLANFGDEAAEISAPTAGAVGVVESDAWRVVWSTPGTAPPTSIWSVPPRSGRLLARD